MKFRPFLLLATLVGVLVGILPAAAQDAPFPVTIEHKYGSTTIEAAPQRVVSIGFTEQDPLFALGVQPVGIRYWYGDASDAIFPWAESAAAGAEPVVLNLPYGNLDYEAILALNPDLISANDSGITQEEYDSLSQIAPTIAQSGDYNDFGQPWQVTTVRVGESVGKAAEAEALVDGVAEQVADIRAQHPQFEGKSIAVAYRNAAGSFGYYTEQDGRGRFFTDLGFVVPDELNEIAGDSFYADITNERLDLLDQDLLVFIGLQFVEGGREAIESDPFISQLNAVKEGRVLYVPADVEDALQFSTVLSLPYALDGIVPQLEAIFPGEATPEATVEPTEQAAAESSQTAMAGDCPEGMWLFDHERLATDPVCIPENPQRIISLDMPATEFVLLNDIPIVGVFGYAADEISAITPGLGAKLEGIPTFDWPPNFELAASLNPDLIIAFKDSSLFYEGMEAIAPIVVYDAAYATDWKSSTSFWSQVFGKEDAYTQMLATYDARVAELQTALGDDRADIDVSAFVPSADYPMIWLKDSAQGIILQDVGLGRPDSQDVTFAEGGYAEGGADYGYVRISQEVLNLADGDEIYIFTYPTTDPDTAAQLQQGLEDFNANDPIWQSLSGVQAGHVHIVGAHWFRAQTYLAANLILDDLFATLTDVEPTIPSPAAQYVTAEAAS